MKPTEPRLIAPKVRVAEEQPEFEPVTVALVSDKGFAAIGAEDDGKFHYNTVIMAFELSETERLRISSGEPVYVALLTYGKPQQAIRVTAGPDELAKLYGLEVEPRKVLEMVPKGMNFKLSDRYSLGRDIVAVPASAHAKDVMRNREVMRNRDDGEGPEA